MNSHGLPTFEEREEVWRVYESRLGKRVTLGAALLQVDFHTFRRLARTINVKED